MAIASSLPVHWRSCSRSIAAHTHDATPQHTIASLCTLATAAAPPASEIPATSHWAAHQRNIEHCPYSLTRMCNFQSVAHIHSVLMASSRPLPAMHVGALSALATPPPNFAHGSSPRTCPRPFNLQRTHPNARERCALCNMALYAQIQHGLNCHGTLHLLSSNTSTLTHDAGPRSF